jgi:alpha-beta hydrolase superfamily lysophospholipase
MTGKYSILKLLIATLFLLVVACVPNTEQYAGVVREAQLSAEAFITTDNMALPMRVWSVQSQPPVGIVIALHGFNDYSNAYADTGTYFAAHHIVTYAYDQRGFGGAGKRGTWAGTETYVQDLREVCREVRQRHPGIPLYVLGESMGGAIAMLAFTSDRPPLADGVILSAPAVWARSTMPWYQRLALFIGARLFPWASFTGEGIDITPSDNRDMLIALGQDPLVIKATKVGAMYGLTNLMDEAMTSAQSFNSPALIMIGDLDEIVPNHASALMLSKLLESDNSQQKVVVYGQGYHMLTRDLQGPVVMADVAAWINNPNDPLPSNVDRVDVAKWIEENLPQ